MLRSAVAAAAAVSPRDSPAGDELGEQRVQPIDGLGSGADQVIVVFGTTPKGGDRFVDDGGVEASCGVRGDADRQSVGLVRFAAVSGREQPDSTASFADASTTSMWSAVSLGVSAALRPVAPSTARTACSQRLAKRRSCR